MKILIASKFRGFFKLLFEMALILRTLFGGE